MALSGCWRLPFVIQNHPVRFSVRILGPLELEREPLAIRRVEKEQRGGGNIKVAVDLTEVIASAFVGDDASPLQHPGVALQEELSQPVLSVVNAPAVDDEDVSEAHPLGAVGRAHEHELGPKHPLDRF